MGRYRDRRMTWRSLLGLLGAAAASAFGALVLGEYEFTGTLPFLAGPLFGLAVGEVVVAVGRARALTVGMAAAAVAAAGVV